MCNNNNNIIVEIYTKIFCSFFLNALSVCSFHFISKISFFFVYSSAHSTYIVNKREKKIKLRTKLMLKQLANELLVACEYESQMNDIATKSNLCSYFMLPSFFFCWWHPLHFVCMIGVKHCCCCGFLVHQSKNWIEFFFPTGHYFFFVCRYSVDPRIQCGVKWKNKIKCYEINTQWSKQTDSNNSNNNNKKS